MTDVLAERFAALADAHDDSDWLDVRRRARRRHTRFVVPAALVAAAVAASASIAAISGHWIINSKNDGITAATDVSLAGRTWHVSLKTIAPQLSVCFTATSGSTTRSSCQAGFRRSRQQPVGSPFGASHLTVPGGQIWIGMTIGFVRRVAITDASGHVYSAPTADAPRGVKTPFRYWAIAVANPPVRALSAYDDQGHKLPRYLGF